MAMGAASVFFLLSLDAGGGKWRNSMLVSALITGIAAVHYLYMRDAYAAMGDEGVTAFRYVDWILTVPLMCVEFYLILQKAGDLAKELGKLNAAKKYYQEIKDDFPKSNEANLIDIKLEQVK